ncbi:DsbA family protein [Thalassobacillus pellis]|uniref:DsbA family protein n=1 Tax=Thalassobacillus pellis TaxID=748008 RepID=UPI001961692C|nr:DsbA family protein [Thalassobacillus pellis]MBM7552046.1 protein-disulfide isomerase [Thalassobacillus pellis]
MAQNNKGSMKFIVILTVAVIAIIAAFVIVDNMTKEETAENDTSTPAEPPSIEGQPTLGEKNAPVQIVEFGDYKCPSCKAWSEQVYPQLKADYVDSGKASLSYINVLFHGEASELAAKASEAVYKQAPDHFFEFSKAVYEAQPESHEEEWVTTEKLLKIAGETVPDIDLEQMREDMESEAIAQEVQKDSQMVEEYGIRLTPSVMINGQLVENPFDYEKITSIIEEELEGNNE